MKDIFVEQLFVLINPVWDLSPAHDCPWFGRLWPNSLPKNFSQQQHVETH